MTLEELVNEIADVFQSRETVSDYMREQIKSLLAENATMKGRARELTPTRPCPHGRTDEHTHSIACDA